MNVTFLLLNQPDLNTGWATATAQQVVSDGKVFSIFPYAGQKKINNIKVRDISTHPFRQFIKFKSIRNFQKMLVLKNSAISAGDSMWLFGDLSYIQQKIMKIAPRADHIKIILDSPPDDAKSRVIYELLNLLNYASQDKPTPVRVYFKKNFYSESEDYANFWTELEYTVGNRKNVLVIRPNWILCGTDTHTRNLLTKFSENDLSYIQLLITPSLKTHQSISPYKREANFASLNDFVHKLNRIQVIKIGLNLLFRPKIEKSVVLTHELIYSMAIQKWRLRQILKRCRPDSIFVTHYFNIKRAEKIKKNFQNDVILVCDTHDIQAINYEQQGYKGYLSRRVPRLSTEIAIECNILEKTDHLIFLSESEKLFFKKYSKSNIPTTLFIPPITVKPAPVKRSQEKKIKRSDSPILIVMSDNKGNQLGLDWFVKEVLPLMPQQKVTVIGAIQRYAQKNPALMKNDQIKFIGVVEDLREPYDEASVVAVPVIRGAGIAIKTLEALAYGKPIVASPLGFRGINSKLKTHFIAHTPEEFAYKLISICKSSAKARASQVYSRRLQKEIAPRMQFEKILWLLK